ncbi:MULTISPECIES: hypothetical protein [Streptomyces]|uniref:hypothetical protein n=1 Tax=Streptomyces TaxID=1883 RepID=UPI00163C96E4|nr:MULTISPECIES: hypothetical protein [Streptomyces]MBC2874308.1 hypothetical protein [Streptomyces sp. TYQ1024]UBI40343.1 hypothetical protein K7I03_30435 [Streptomyces mobaraensis]UKW32923.1 hypothetical protein MCU78_30355 [Streptomyces sp. TYQ1024]
MSLLPPALNSAALLAAATGLTGAVTLLAVVVASVAARSPQRRRDARATLRILVRRRPRR